MTIGLRSTLLLLNGLVASAMISLAMQAWQASQTQQAAQARQAELAEALHLSKQVDLMHDSLRAGVQASLLVGQVPGLDQFEARQRIRDDGTTYYETLQRLAQLPLPQAMRDRVLKVSDEARLYAVEAHKVVQTAAVDRSAAIAGLVAVDSRYKSVRRELDDLGESLGDLLHKAQVQAAAEAAESRNSLLWACGLTIAAASAVVAMLTFLIRRHVRHLAEVAQAIADGDLERRVGQRGGDELAYLGQAIDKMADSLSQMIAAMRSEAGRAAFERQLAEALDMADSEQQVAQVTTQAMGDLMSGRPMELLVSDSSRAHMERLAEHPQAGAPGCGVVSPFDCVAVRRGSLVTFENSDALSACRHLRGRPCGPTSAVCVPLAFMGRAVGVLHATAPIDSPLSAGHTRQLRTLGAQVGMRIGTVRAFERSQIQASTDGLTGLPNRRTIEQRLRGLARGEQEFAVVMCDLDNFKHLNDSFGHVAGDAALRIFSEVLRHSLRESDLAGRWGGEEFMFVLAGADAKAADEQVDRLRARLAQTLYGGKAPRFTVSFGIADSTMSRRPDQLLRWADLALYQAKADGRDRARVADPTMPLDEPMLRRMAMPDSESAALYGDEAA